MIGFKHVKFTPNEYVIAYKKGKIIKEGVGISFFVYEKNTSIVMIPTSDIDANFAFAEMTNDYQKVTIQGQITYRINDYKKISKSMDFSLNLKKRGKAEETLEKLSKRVVNIANVLVKKYIEKQDLTDAIKAGTVLAESVLEKFKSNSEIEQYGIEIIGLSILAISPNAETARALEAQTREQILKQADDALYERRNSSIEQERKVKENELNTEIAVGTKQKQIKDSELETKKMVMEKENQIKEQEMKYRINLENAELEHTLNLSNTEIEHKLSLSDKEKKIVEAEVENEKRRAEVQTYQFSAMIQALNNLDADVLIAMAEAEMSLDKMKAKALRELAGKINEIGEINLTPDLLQALMGKKESFTE